MSYQANPTVEALIDIKEERQRQVAKWGPQSHPNGTGAFRFKTLRAVYTRINDDRAAAGEPGVWVDIFLEEVYEALAETDPALLRKELIQAAAVATAWVEDLDAG